MKKNVLLGYEIGTADEVTIQPAHLIVTGVTQQSGKTTTLEALIQRSGAKAIVFKTKIGEKGITRGTYVTPFFREKSDYAFVKSLIEAYSKERLNIEKGTLMRLSKGTNSLAEIKERLDEKLEADKPPRGLTLEIYTRLQHYLENLIPQIRNARLSSTLDLQAGVNIMDLERFTDEVQSLIIASVAEEVLNGHQDTVLVIPEAWKFLPQRRGNPCKESVEAFIRQGATNGNYVWIDSQDMTGVDKQPLKQISTWILGYQSEKNEVKHTLDQISLPAKSKPSTDDIMTLKIGHFYLSERSGVVPVYVRPSWLSEEDAKLVALGDKDVSELPQPDKNIGYDQQSRKEPEKLPSSVARKDLVELRADFFAKIDELVERVDSFHARLDAVEARLSEVVDEEEIVSKVLQKVPQRSTGASVDVDAVVAQVLKRLPSGGGATYTVSPLDALKKQFLQEARDKIIADVQSQDEEGQKMLLFIESLSRRTNTSEVMEKGLHLNPTSGSRSRITKKLKELENAELIRRDDGSHIYGNVREAARKYMGVHDASDEEIEQLYNHVLQEVME